MAEHTLMPSGRPRVGDLADITIRARVVWVDNTGCCYRVERGGEEFNLGAVHNATPVLTKEQQRRRAVDSWPAVETFGEKEALRKWVLYGDMSEVGDPHYALICEFEDQHGVMAVR